MLKGLRNVAALKRQQKEKREMAIKEFEKKNPEIVIQKLEKEIEKKNKLIKKQNKKIATLRTQAYNDRELVRQYGNIANYWLAKAHIEERIMELEKLQIEKYSVQTMETDGFIVTIRFYHDRLRKLLYKSREQRRKEYVRGMQ